jgi:two-component system response regulator AtoC
VLVFSRLWVEDGTQDLALMSKQHSDRTTLKGGDTVLHARTTLVLYHRDGAMVAQLDKGKSVVVGRAAPSDVEIHDLGLSRQHARFTWDEQGIFVEDLDSTNGTKKNGQKVKRAKIAPGDEISIGPVMVSVHVMSSIDDELRGFDGHDRFVAALADELTRARTFQRPLALVMVRGGKDAHVSRWASRLRARLRPVDRVGIYGLSSVLVSLPEATSDLVRTLAEELTGGDPALACTSVMFPQDGGSVDELIAAVQSGRADRKSVPIDTSGIIVKNTAMKEVMATVKRLAGSTIGVLINGETGSGKEVIAQAIHDGGPRKKAPLRAINCAAIPQTLLESVLFGHEQGAFTGADKATGGIFEQANGGTVFLDEIGELAPSAQAALLRVLETHRVMRVGGHKEIEVDVRVIAATHRDLEAMVEAGRFRQDLLYRLNTMTLRIPPLRERVDEIKPLAERFLKDASSKAGAKVRSIDAKALEALEAYAWPGNVRELRNVIERAVVLAEGGSIQLADLTEKVRGGTRAHTSVEPESVEDQGSADYRERVRKFETELIIRALHKANGNQTEAAKALNLPLRTLVHKIQTYGIKKKFDR